MHRTAPISDYVYSVKRSLSNGELFNVHEYVGKIMYEDNYSNLPYSHILLKKFRLNFSMYANILFYSLCSPFEILDECGEVFVFGAFLLQQAPRVSRLLLQQLQVQGTHQAGVAAAGPAWQGASVYGRRKETIGKISLITN